MSNLKKAVEIAKVNHMGTWGNIEAALISDAVRPLRDAVEKYMETDDSADGVRVLVELAKWEDVE